MSDSGANERREENGRVLYRGQLLLGPKFNKAWQATLEVLARVPMPGVSRDLVRAVVFHHLVFQPGKTLVCITEHSLRGRRQLLRGLDKRHQLLLEDTFDPRERHGKGLGR